MRFSSEDEKAIRSPVNVPFPPQTKFPEISTLSLISIVPPVEFKIKLPVDVSIVLSLVVPTRILPNVPPDDTIAPPPPMVCKLPPRTISLAIVTTPTTLTPPPTNRSLDVVTTPTKVEGPVTFNPAPTLRFFSIPTPPSVISDPVSLSVESVVFVISTTLLILV